MKIAKVISEQEGLSPEKAQEIWDAFEKFGGYAFNKSHSVAYSLISYQSMWLKTHYPAEFFAAALTILGEDKHQGLVKDALTYGIRVLPPDVNVSSNRIEIRTLEDGSQVLYAPFSAVKGCSENGCQAIMRAREKVGGKFESLEQFEEAVEKRACNSRVTMLAKEIVFCHGEHAVVALPNILGAAGISATEREFALVSEQVVKIIARVAKHLNHDAIKFDEAAASKRINESKGA